MTEADLIHFVNAQAQVYRHVVEELTDGRKRTRWMWFVFPVSAERECRMNGGRRLTQGELRSLSKRQDQRPTVSTEYV